MAFANVNMTPSLFQAAPFYFLRTPIWSIEDYNRIMSNPAWIESVFHLYESDQLLREAISIASPPLYSLLEQKPIKNAEEVAASLLNYIIRMSTRPTPFGLFSAVATGSWGKKTSMFFDLQKIEKRARPDMEWLFSFTQKLYQKRSPSFSSLEVYTNPLVCRIGERYFLSYLQHVARKGKNFSTSTSIRANKLTESICDIAKEPIKIENLWHKLKEILPFLDKEKTEEVLISLLEQQILFPAALPSLLSRSPFNDFLHKCPEASTLIPLDRKISEYNQTSVGKGEEILKQIQQDMDPIASSRTFLQVDTVYKAESLQLSKSISQELEKSLDILWKISAARASFSSLSIYHKKFVEKYGVHQTVPIMDLISEEKGIGPLDKIQAQESKPSVFSEKWEKWLHEKWQACLHEKNQEIVLTQGEIDHLLDLAQVKLPNPKNALLSMDVFCKIIANSQEDIDEGRFQILFYEQTWQAGATMGRFLDMLGRDIEKDLGQLLREEEQLDQSVLFSELSYWPSEVRMANVTAHPPLRSYHLDFQGMSTPSSLSLDNIYVGASSKRLYLTTREGKSELVFCQGNMLNLVLAPPVLQLIDKISLSRYQLPYPFSFGSLQKDAVYLPRVRFNKTILSPSQWALNSDCIEKGKISSIISQFTAWADKWNLPTRFFLVRFDQSLLMDRSYPRHLKEIALKLRKGESLRFFEEIPQSWFKSSRGAHLAEIVVPFLKNSLYTKEQKDLIPIPHRSFPTQKRLKLPGSEWVSIKLYMDEETDYFLVNYLDLFIQSLTDKMQITSWFFLRYADPDLHLRLRVKLKSTNQLNYFLLLLEKNAMSWVESGLIKNMILSSYEREIERYGGINSIEFAEAIFCADSSVTLLLLKSQLDKRLDCHESVLYAFSIISFLNDFGLSHAEMTSLLGFEGEDKSELQAFREHRTSLIALINQEDPTSIEQQLMHEASYLRRQVHNQFLQSYQKNYSTSLFDIYTSLIHMHCNRLGCDSKSEARARLYARHALLYLQNKAAATKAYQKGRIKSIQAQ